MAAVGYEFLRETLGLSAFELGRPALIKPVTRIEPADTFLAVPKHVAPNSADPVEHTLFALKHEGVNLQILAEALPKIDPASLLAELRRQPNGSYIRTACYLWERLTGNQLADIPEIGGPTAELFDPARYITGPSRRDARWRVSFNGLGSIDYCATVERTSVLQNAMASNILERVKEFVDTLGKAVLDRALAWAYLHETEDSFAIEREAPSEDKARMFIALLHHALCRSGKLEKGLLLPVSVAMKRNEDDYLATLQGFSKPARERWSVRWVDEGDYDMRFNGHPAIYRYWNATSCVEFGFRMAEQALEVDLRSETQFLARYDRIVKEIDERFDVRGSDLATLVVSALDNGGKVSKRRRKQFEGRVPESVFDSIEELAAQEDEGSK